MAASACTRNAGVGFTLASTALSGFPPPTMKLAAWHGTLGVCVLITLAMVSCAAPKAEVVAETPKPKPLEKSVEPIPELPEPGQADDGLRLPDMLALPSEGDLNSSLPVPRPSDGGAVIARPPTDPPPRPKQPDTSVPGQAPEPE